MLSLGDLPDPGVEPASLMSLALASRFFTTPGKPIYIYDAYGTQALGSCSAAETALLALSFTLALQEVSKHDSLLFIDTPIGRVGVENRNNFMDTLLAISRNKQVILTFTPTEYDTNVQRILANNYNTFYSLTMINNITNAK